MHWQERGVIVGSAEVDRLEVAVKANAQSANAQLDALINRLTAVNSALRSVNSGGLQGLANGVQRFSSSMQSMKSVGTADFTRLTKNIQKLTSIDTVSLNRSASAINTIGKSLNRLGAVNQNAVDIGNVVKNISKLGNKSVQTAVTTIPQLARALSQMMAILSKAPKVSSNVIQMTNALAGLAKQGRSVGSAASSLQNGFTKLSLGMSSATSSTKGLAAAFGKFYATWWLLLKVFKQFGKAIDISSDLTEVQNVVDVTFGQMRDKVESFSKEAITEFGMSELTAKEIASRFQGMGVAMGLSASQVASGTSFINDKLSQLSDTSYSATESMADMSINLTKLAADMASFYNVDQEAVAEDLESIFTGQTRPLRTYGLDLTQATLKEWALKNGIDADIDSMSQAEKTMLRYQYVMANTSAAQGDFARTSDTWANQIRILQNQFQQLGATIGNALINTLKPVVSLLNQLTAKLIVFTETVVNALGAILGWKLEISDVGITSDADAMEDIADSAEDAANSAKKMQSYLLGIDELNVISDSSSSSGKGDSSDSSSSGGTTDSKYEITESEGLYKSFINNMEGLGEYIGEAITNQLNSIKWNNIYQSAKNFGKGFADFLNGLISPELFSAVGKTIASSLNTAVYAALSFGENFNWSNLGTSIASGINTFFGTFDFSALADTLNTWVDGLEEMIGAAIKDLDCKTIFKGISDFLDGLEPDTIAALIGIGVIKRFGSNISAAIKSKMGAIILEAGLVITIVEMSFSIARSITKSFFEWYDEKYGTNYAEGYDEMSGKLSNWDIVVEGAKLTFNKDGKFQILGLENLKALFGGNDIVDTIYGGLNGGLLLASRKLNVKEFFDSAFKGAIGQWFTTHVAPWFTKQKWEGLGQNVKDALTEKWEEFVSWWGNTGIVKWWNNHVAPWFTRDRWLQLGENVKSSLKEKWESFTSWWSNTGIVKWWNTHVSPWFTKARWGALGQNVKSALAEKWESFVSWWSNTGIVKWWNNHVAPWFTSSKWSSIASGIKSGLKTAWGNFTSWWGNTGFAQWWSGVTSKFSSDSWNFSGIKEGLSSAWSGAIETLKSKWNDFAKWLNNKMTIKLDTTTVIGKGISSILGSSTIKLANLPTFSTGGFPEDGLFYANHSELVGTFSNGKTAVANNDQIVTGITAGVQAGMNVDAQISYFKQMVSLLEDIKQKNPNIVFDTREGLEALKERENRNGFVFT